MYKVFLNDRVIHIVPPGKITLIKSFEIINGIDGVENTKKWFSDFVNCDDQEVYIINPDPEKFFRKIFYAAFFRIDAAGGVVKRDNKILLIFRNNIWDLPKGKIDSGETRENAAIREVEEECGITGLRIIKTLPSTFHIYQSPHKKNKGKWILKETFWFEMDYFGDADGQPQNEENITEVRWFEKNHLHQALSNTYSSLKPLLSLYLD